MVKIEIDISKKGLIFIIIGIFLLGGIGVVISLGSGDPSIHGHTIDEFAGMNDVINSLNDISISLNDISASFDGINDFKWCTCSIMIKEKVQYYDHSYDSDFDYELSSVSFMAPDSYSSKNDCREACRAVLPRFGFDSNSVSCYFSSESTSTPDCTSY